MGFDKAIINKNDCFLTLKRKIRFLKNKLQNNKIKNK